MKRTLWSLLAVVMFGGNAFAGSLTLRQLQSGVWTSGDAHAVLAGGVPAYDVALVQDAGQQTNALRAEIINERNTILMLAAMSSVYVNYNTLPPGTAGGPRGYDIDAVLAWDVENVGKTPRFVIERNRNYEHRGDIFHAERMAMEKAYEVGRAENYNLPSSASPEEIFNTYDRYLANATIYTSLEPCPMCTTTMLLARVPHAIYCMEDPGLRDPQTHQTSASTPVLKAVYGRKLSQEMSTVDQCVNTNKTMWADTSRWKTSSDPKAAPDHPEWGKSFFDLIAYLHDRAPAFYGPAYDQLSNYTVQYAENQQLLENLRKAVRKP